MYSLDTREGHSSAVAWHKALLDRDASCQVMLNRFNQMASVPELAGLFPLTNPLLP